MIVPDLPGLVRRGVSAAAGPPARALLPVVCAVLALVLVFPAAAGAAPTQVGAGSQSLRPYWHVFAAYAAAWLLVLGWLVAVARRMARIERKLGA